MLGSGGIILDSHFEESKTELFYEIPTTLNLIVQPLIGDYKSDILQHLCNIEEAEKIKDIPKKCYLTRLREGYLSKKWVNLKESL